ncbi:MAG: VanZ family protein [Ignavibacteria bacterium]|jgi:VanZ family protein|nr:VanZ family protein [Ignavibacteria bacterium]
MLSIKHFKQLSLIQLLLASLICIYFSSIEYIELPNIDFDFLDKLLHLSAFFIYGLSLQVAFIVNMESIEKKLKMKLTARKICIIIFVIGSIFAASDEIHQYYVPGRSADIMDWVFDNLGIALSLLFYNSINKIWKKLSENSR